MLRRALKGLYDVSQKDLNLVIPIQYNKVSGYYISYTYMIR